MVTTQNNAGCGSLYVQNGYEKKKTRKEKKVKEEKEGKNERKKEGKGQIVVPLG